MKIKSVTIVFIWMVFAVSIFGQEDKAVKFVALRKTVEISPRQRDENADFVAVDIKIDGTTIKTFSADSVIFPEIIGTFSGSGGDYAIYRTSTGSGACAGGSLYVIKFGEDISTGRLTGVMISPVLTACLGEYPLFNLNYDKNAEIIVTIAGHSINADSLTKWIEDKPRIVLKKRAK